MMEDLQGATVTPGQPTPMLSSRVWVEHRSRIGAYKTSAHAAWTMSGALDCLFKGDVTGCRARLNLGLLQLDQTAIDKGNWVLASGLSLEPPPPFASLAQHVLPDPARGDLPFSRLLDPRWAEISVAHLQDRQLSDQKEEFGKGLYGSDEGELGSDPKTKGKSKTKAEIWRKPSSRRGRLKRDLHDVPEAPTVPGERASTVSVASFLNSLPRSVFRSRCTFDFWFFFA